MREAIATLIRLSGEFGLSPAARLRMEVAEEAPEDALEAFLKSSRPRHDE